MPGTMVRGSWVVSLLLAAGCGPADPPSPPLPPTSSAVAQDPVPADPLVRALLTGGEDARKAAEIDLVMKGPQKEASLRQLLEKTKNPVHLERLTRVLV